MSSVDSMGITIENNVKKKLFMIALIFYYSATVLEGLLREVFVQITCILGKLNDIYKHKWKARRRGESLESEIVSSSSRWSNALPQEIVEMILQRLCLNDSLRLGAVCSSWRSAISTAIFEKRCLPVPQFPLLMFCANERTDKDPLFLSLSNNRIYVPKQPGLYGTNCIGSIEGWLMVSDSIAWQPEGFSSFCSPTFTKIKNYFLNPVSGARIMLPSQTAISSRHSSNAVSFKMKKVVSFSKLVATTVPTSPNCIVAALSTCGELAFCKPHGKSWNRIKNDESLRFVEIELHEGKLYTVTMNVTYFIMVFDLQDFSPGRSIPKTKVLVTLPLPVGNCNWRREGQTVCVYDNATYHLVRDNASNNILLAVRTYDCVYEEDSWLRPMLSDYSVPPKVKGFKVFKLDLSDPQLVPVVTLGDRILFVAYKNCKLISVTSIGECQEDLRGNCIYFAFDYLCTGSPLLGHDIGVFCLADGSIKHHFPSVSRSWFGNKQPIWFTPYPW